MCAFAFTCPGATVLLHLSSEDEREDSEYVILSPKQALQKPEREPASASPGPAAASASQASVPFAELLVPAPAARQPLRSSSLPFGRSHLVSAASLGHMITAGLASHLREAKEGKEEEPGCSGQLAAPSLPLFTLLVPVGLGGAPRRSCEGTEEGKVEVAAEVWQGQPRSHYDIIIMGYVCT